MNKYLIMHSFSEYNNIVEADNILEALYIVDDVDKIIGIVKLCEE